MLTSIKTHELFGLICAAKCALGTPASDDAATALNAVLNVSERLAEELLSEVKGFPEGRPSSDLHRRACDLLGLVKGGVCALDTNAGDDLSAPAVAAILNAAATLAQDVTNAVEMLERNQRKEAA